MSTLAEARRQFVLLTRRYDLLSGGLISTNIDNGANIYINKAQRWLDMNVTYDFMNRREVLQLAAGDVYLATERLISVQGLRGITSEGASQPREWKDLTRFFMSYPEFRELTPGLVNEWDSGPLEGWTIYPKVTAPKTSRLGVSAEALDQPATLEHIPNLDEHVTSGTFASDDGWNLGGSDPNDWQISSGTLHITPPNTLGSHIPAWQLFEDMAVQMVPGRTYRCTFSITLSDTPFAEGIYLVINNEPVFHKDTSGTESADFEFTLGELSEDAFEDPFGENTDSGPVAQALVFVAYKLSDETYTIDNFSITEVVSEDEAWDENGLLFYPAPDVDYTIEITGRFFSEELENDDDYSVWTKQYMDLLVKKAAQLYYEELGNTQKMRHFEEACFRWLNEIDNKQVELEMTGLEMEMER